MARSSNRNARVGIVVVTHGGAADCFLDIVGKILGPLPASIGVSVSMQESFDDTLQRIAQACDQVDEGLGVVLLVDLHGSSPYQACMAILDGTRDDEVVSGVNLAMLLKMWTVDRHTQSARDIALLAQDCGRRSIQLGSELTGRLTLEGAHR
jgi:PTS system mannose-specific IIA component